MISEPELSGGSEGAEPEPAAKVAAAAVPATRPAEAGAPGPGAPAVGAAAVGAEAVETAGAGAADAGPPAADVVAGGERSRGGGPFGRRAWLWGIGGALLASAAWAAGLQFHEKHEATGHPDLHGYALGESPCAGATLTRLTGAMGVTDSEPVSPSAVHLGEALDQIRCTLFASAPLPSGGTARYEVSVSIDLHKETDPRVEFEDQQEVNPADLDPVEATTTVPALGDEAFLQTVSDQTRRLEVLHGGAVFALTLTGYNKLPVSDDTVSALHSDDAAPDVGRFQPAMVEAMRTVMKTQKREGR